ncbi:hypothetical protein KSS87_012821 [Heliosperma pusillum]|nr:hypothetical protein KSS87_012821 [Heliosperma pusillum]
MANSTLMMKLACALVMCMLMSAQYGDAVISCGQVTSSVSSCIGYLKGGPGPSMGCCNGIKSLSNAARSTPDRQIACNCLKKDAAAISDLDFGLAAGYTKQLYSKQDKSV